MGEAIWCTFRAKVPTTWNGPEWRDRYTEQMRPGVPKILAGIYEGLYDGDCDVTVNDDGSTEWTIQGLGNYGHYAIEECFGALEEAGVPFEFIDEPKYEYSGEHHVFDGQRWHLRDSDTNGVVLTQQGWTNLRQEAEEADDLAALSERVDRYFNPPSAGDCSIAHLPAKDPTDEEEEDEDADGAPAAAR